MSKAIGRIWILTATLFATSYCIAESYKVTISCKTGTKSMKMGHAEDRELYTVDDATITAEEYIKGSLPGCKLDNVQLSPPNQEIRKPPLFRTYVVCYGRQDKSKKEEKLWEYNGGRDAAIWYSKRKLESERNDSQECKIESFMSEYQFALAKSGYDPMLLTKSVRMK